MRAIDLDDRRVRVKDRFRLHMGPWCYDLNMTAELWAELRLRRNGKVLIGAGVWQVGPYERGPCPCCGRVMVSALLYQRGGETTATGAAAH